MGMFSGLKKISDWVTPLDPMDWFRAKRDAGKTSQNVFKADQSDKDKFVAKQKLVKKMRK
jgi:hypothetical protein